MAPGTDTDPGAASLSRASCVVTRPVAGSTRKWVLVRLYTTTLLLPAAESASVEAMMAALPDTRRCTRVHFPHLLRTSSLPFALRGQLMKWYY